MLNLQTLFLLMILSKLQAHINIHNRQIIASSFLICTFLSSFHPFCLLCIYGRRKHVEASQKELWIIMLLQKFTSLSVCLHIYLFRLCIKKRCWKRCYIYNILFTFATRYPFCSRRVCLIKKNSYETNY